MIISIDDERDYHVDMVLATLVDDSTPLHPTQTTETAASNASSTAANSSTPRPSQTARQRHQVGQHPEERGASMEHHSDPEGESAMETGVAGDLGAVHGSRQTLSSVGTSHRLRAADVEVAFPSGSQFRQTNSRKPTRTIPLASHVPLPPQDVEFMETDSMTQQHQTPFPGTEDNDVMDALFGEDNMDGAAKGGQIFGFDHGRENHLLYFVN